MSETAAGARFANVAAGYERCQGSLGLPVGVARCTLLAKHAGPHVIQRAGGAMLVRWTISGTAQGNVVTVSP